MGSQKSTRGWIILAAVLLAGLAGACREKRQQKLAPHLESRHHSINAVALSPDGRTAYAVSQTSSAVFVVDLVRRRVERRLAVGPFPTDVVVSPDGRLLYVTSLYSYSVEVVPVATASGGEKIRSIPVGWEPYGLTLSPDGRRLYVGNSMSDDVSVVDTGSGETLRRVPVGRTPRHLALTAGGKLVVADRLGRQVSVVDPVAGKVTETRDLARASLLHEVTCSAKGRWCYVAHLVAHDEEMTTQMERGWINSNGFSVMDISRRGHRVTLLLDRLLEGAANPWGVALDPAGRWLFVSLAGVHQLAVVDLAKAHRIVAAAGGVAARVRLERDVELLDKTGFARRVPTGGSGPRGIAYSAALGRVVVGHYFSEDLSLVDPVTGKVDAVIPMGPRQRPGLWRQGEMMFNDARYSHQTWNSCASCHQEDASMDGLNWDLANDGFGNPKNAKSLRDVRDTPPAMWSGVRPRMTDAVAGGMRFLGFLPRRSFLLPVQTFLGSPRRMPNPHGRASPRGVSRGKKAFHKAGCGSCHPAPTFTDNKFYDLGLRQDFEERDEFDTPSLRECYRTAPYLHHGGARSLEVIFKQHDPKGVHGQWRSLSGQEFSDMLTYVRSL